MIYMAFQGELHPGSKLGNLLIERQVSVDDSGQLYAALIQPNGIRALVRVLPPQLSVPGPALQQLLGKLQKFSTCRSPHLGQMVAFDQTATIQRWLIVTSIGNATSLAERIAQKNLTPPAVVAIMKQTLTGMQLAHANGFVHGDINLENIVIGIDGKVKILNFAFAGVSETDRHARGEFQAPELLNTGVPNILSDVYSLGIVFNKLFASVGLGRVPVGIRRVAEKMSTRETASRFSNMASALKMLGAGASDDAFEDAQKIITRNFENTRTIQLQVDREIRNADRRSKIPTLIALGLGVALGFAAYKKYAPMLKGKDLVALSSKAGLEAFKVGKSITGVEKLEAAKQYVIDTKDQANEDTKRRLATAEAATDPDSYKDPEPKKNP